MLKVTQVKYTIENLNEEDYSLLRTAIAHYFYDERYNERLPQSASKMLLKEDFVNIFQISPHDAEKYYNN